MRTQRRGLLAGVVERVAKLVRHSDVIRLFVQMAVSRARAGRRRTPPKTWRGAPRSRPTWRCPGLSERERAYWARLFAQWKVDAPPPDFTERLVAHVMAAMRARCPAAGAETVELPDGGFNPRACDAPSTDACKAKNVREKPGR